MYTNRGSYLPEIDRFSPTFFGISPREAQGMDPQQRLLLELHWEALENAGIDPRRLAQQQVGVFVGIGTTDYADLQVLQGPTTNDSFTGTGGSHAAAAGRISYVLGMRGPSLAVDTACSSSLVSVHLAMISLRSGESDLALASAVCLNISPAVFVSLCRAKMLSPDGYCKVFDASANGYVRGEGAGVLVLKRLSDALADGDRIEAVLRGSAMNHNGRSAGLTVPGGLAQQEVIRAALRNAGVAPSDVSYLEAHGTGTAVGDPIEASALGAVFAGRTAPLLIGSVKTNLGHLEWAAGMAGLIKTILSIQHGVIPPTLHLRNPNPMIPWDQLPVRVVTEVTPWPEGKRIAGVSSFGFGGTNAHVVVEEAPSPQPNQPLPELPFHLLTLSARGETALRKLAEQFGGVVGQMPAKDLGSICYTANTGRARFEHRLTVTTNNNRELAMELGGFATQVGSPRVRTGRAPATPPAVGMMFTGQGSQVPGMGKELYRTESLFRRAIDHCSEIFSHLQPRSLQELLFGNGIEIHQTRYAQPALFAFEYALACLWRSWGVEPDAVFGHSVGEYVAACVAGVFEPEDALRLLEARGRLMWNLPQNGAMFAIRTPEDRVLPHLAGLAERLSIAAVNSPAETVISGERNAAESVAEQLREEGAAARELTVSHAFHSPLMAPILDEFAEVAASVTYRQPTLRLISNVTGQEVGAGVLDAAYWVDHIRKPVRFMDCIHTAESIGCAMFLEAGPHPVLCGLGKQTLPSADLTWLPSLHAKRDEWVQLLDSAGEMFVRGLDLDWHAFDHERHAAGQRRKIALPTYPFERERYWFPGAGGGPRGGALRPLAESFTQSPLVKEKILSVTLGTVTHPYLAGHRVFGQVVIPGAAYLSLLATAAELLGWPGCTLEKLFFLAPLAVPEGEGRAIQAVLSPAEGDTAQFGVALAALSADGPTIEASRLLSARIERLEASEPSLANIDALRQRCRERVEVGSLYDSVREAGIELGQSFQWIEELWLGKGEALAKLRLPEAAGTMDGYRVHPALLDSGFQVASAILDKDRQGETLLPFSLARMRLTGAASGNTWWCHAVMTGHSAWDIRYYGVGGEIFAEMEGFEMREAPASTFMRRRTADWLYRVDWQVQPIRETVPRPGSWLLLDNHSLEGAALQRLLEAQGNECTVVHEAGAGRIGELLKRDFSCGIVHMWALEAQADRDPAARAQELATGLLNIVQAVIAMPATTPIWIATRHAQAVEASESVNPEQTVLWGMNRGLLVETPDLRMVCVDQDSNPKDAPDHVAEVLAAELNAAPGESQTAWRGDSRYVARLVRCPEAAPSPVEGPFRLQLREYGSPDNLQLAPMKRKKPLRHQVEIAISAAALNFRDVLISLGMLRHHYEGALGLMNAKDIQLGFDCAGVVSAVGEGVDDLAVGDPVMSSCTGSAASYATTYRQGVIRIPKGLDMAVASALPTVFWTAYHALVQLAELKRGERILIHAAAGGVGLAAIQLAQHIGAEIYATASPSKWDYLHSQGVKHIFNSRTLDFADDIMRLTGGEGMDVVLNSMTGPVLERTFSVLKSGGRFVEIGRLEGGMPDEASRRPDAAYFTFDVGTVITRDYDTGVWTGNEIRELFEQGVLRPLPVTEFGIDEAAEAFRFMQQSRHIGKIVLRTEMPLVRADASYLITGGLTGIGLGVARMLTEEGARHMVLAGRRAPSPEASETIDFLRNRGAAVSVVQGDVANPDDVARMLEACRTMAPLRGVFHAAGVLREALIRDQTASHFDTAMAPKVRGAWELHSQTKALPLDYFVCFSSMASMVGSPGQNNYCAANAFLDGLAALRRSQGLPALSVAWGPWAEIGMAAKLEFGGGIDKIPVAEGLDALRTLMRARHVPAGSVGVMKLRWDLLAERFPNAETQSWFSAVTDRARRTKADASFLKTFRTAPEAERQKLLEEHIRDTVRRTLGLGASYNIVRAEAWSALGVDSLMMVEIINRLEASLCLKLPVEMMAREASLRSVSEFALSKIKESASLDEAQPSEHAGEPSGEPLSMRTGFRDDVDKIPQIIRIATDQKCRQVLIDGRWRSDFASCNYLGFDLEPEICAAIPEAVNRWGTHPSWTRAVASPALYQELEQELAKTLGVPDTLVFPSISLLHMGVLPALAGYNGIILTDAASHHSIAEACMRAQAGGTEWRDFRHNDLADLESKLAHEPRSRVKIIATDGVYSMGSPAPPLAEYSRLAKQYNATVYVDDAHGFGIIGESPDEEMPYGHGGNGIVRHLGLDFERDRIVYVAGLSKAFSSYGAFVTCHGETKLLLQSSGPYVFSGPTNVASLATALAGLRLNQRDGDARRKQIYKLTHRLIEAARALEFEIDNAGHFPIVGVVMGDWDHMVIGSQTLWEHDILITPAIFPAVPANRNLVRFSITSANRDSELEQAIGGLSAIREAWRNIPGQPSAHSAAQVGF
jgi:myxalamid-type polyketide synthase MxaB